jgi:hypothetical protein
MKAIPYTNQKGVKRFKPKCSHTHMTNIVFGDSSVGWCLACGEEVDGVEPDARRYICETCNQPTVYGMEELLQMNLVVIT